MVFSDHNKQGISKLQNVLEIFIPFRMVSEIVIILTIRGNLSNFLDINFAFSISLLCMSIEFCRKNVLF